MKNNEYILCSNCGAKIYINDTVYTYDYCGFYCSPQCLCEGCAISVVITNRLAEDCCCEVYEDE